MAPKSTDRGSSYRVDLAVEALSGDNDYGKVTRLAEWYGVSRTTVHEVRRHGQQALVDALDSQCQRRGSRPHTVVVDRQRLERTILSAVMDAGATVRGIQAVVEEAFSVRASVGYIESVTQEGQQRGRRFNETVPLHPVQHAALDEMYSVGRPVLGGVDLDSSFLFLLDVRRQCTGDDWVEALTAPKARGLNPSVVAKDAGTGLQAGVSRALPDAEHQADIFHALYEMGRCAGWLERRAYKEIAMEHKVQTEPIRSIRKGVAASRAARLGRARRRTDIAVRLYDAFDDLRRQAAETMDLVDLETGQPRASTESTAELRRIGEAMMALGHKHTRKAGRYIQRQAERLVAYQDRVRTDLQQAAPKIGGIDAVCLAALLWQLGQRCRAERRRDQRQDLSRRGLAALARLRDLVGDRYDQTLSVVEEIIDRRARASSLIETINSILRRHEFMHRGVSQNFLELFRAWHNLRTYRQGKRKGHSPYELLTGITVNDWLAALGYRPRGPLTSAKKILARSNSRISTQGVELPMAA